MKKLTSDQIREMYIEYFKSKGHEFIDSAPLIPNNDPTLLWINAGVTPLKKFFDGTVIPKNKRMVSSQKCIRTNDIENVGKTARHLTFFEMLGNFSIGDYFKKEAVAYAFELLTDDKYFGFDKDKLYMTIYPDDEETYNLWIEMGVDSSHIIKLEDNFWEIGEGPCGPDTEIFYDRGSKYDPENSGIELLKKEIDNDRYIEIWNNVFSQYNAKEGLERDAYPELPNKNIDTGMGLERMACVLQEVDTNYETDLFVPIIKKIEEISNQEYNDEMAFRVIADHVRALTFAIGDGAFFSNEGRGYVLRRLLRRAIRYGKNLGIEKPFMYKLVDSVITNMGKTYFNLLDEKEKIKKMILDEEKLFHKTLTSGEKKLHELMEGNSTKEITGEDAFKLYDTYGFPFELTLEILNENGFSVSEEEFNYYMDQQREQARSARKSELSMNVQNKALLEFKKESKFVGYDETEIKTKIIGLVKDSEYVDELDSHGYVFLEATPFYAESGGQVADKGIIEGKGFKLEVIDVIKAPHNQHLHVVNVIEGVAKINDNVDAKIDVMRRNSIAKNHSAAHLLQESLREALDENVMQAGSKIEEKWFRFDFTYPDKITDKDIIFAESLVNEKISTNAKTIIEYMDLESAKQKGATALFEDKYDDLVRVVTLYDSIELCGGTHVKNVGDIKKFAIKLIESKGTNVYRIEAATDNNIEHILFEEIKPYNDEMIKLLGKAKKIIEKADDEGIHLPFDVKIDNSVPTSYRDIVFNRSEVANVRDKVKDLEKEYMNKKQNKVLEDLSSFDKLIKSNDDFDYIITKLEDYDLQILKQLIDRLVDKINNGVVFVANVQNGNVNFMAKCQKGLEDKIDCGSLIKEASLKANGNGGGSKVFGQGGGTDVSNIDAILDEVESKILH